MVVVHAFDAVDYRTLKVGRAIGDTIFSYRAVNINVNEGAIIRVMNEGRTIGNDIVGSQMSVTIMVTVDNVIIPTCVAVVMGIVDVNNIIMIVRDVMDLAEGVINHYVDLENSDRDTDRYWL